MMRWDHLQSVPRSPGSPGTNRHAANRFGVDSWHTLLEKFALAHQCSTVTEIITMVLAAGLDLAELHVMERVRRMASAREMIDFMEANSFGNFLSAIPEDLHDTFRADF